MPRLIPSLLAILALVLAGFVAWNLLARENLQTTLSKAVEEHDLSTLEAHVDWENLTRFLSEDLKTRAEGLSAMLGGNTMGPAPGRVEEIVDYYVKPQNLVILLAYKDHYFYDLDLKDFIQSVGFAGLTGIKIRFGLPKEHNRKSHRERLYVTAIFHFVRGKWRVQELHVPMFLVPRRTYDQPAAKTYLKRLQSKR